MWSDFFGRQILARRAFPILRYSFTIFLTLTALWVTTLPHEIWWDYLRDLGYTLAAMLLVMIPLIWSTYNAVGKMMVSEGERNKPKHILRISESYALMVIAMALMMGVRRGEPPQVGGLLVALGLGSLVLGIFSLNFMFRYQLAKERLTAQEELSAVPKHNEP